MSLEANTIGQHSSSGQHIQANSVHKGFMDSLNKTVSHTEAKPSFKTVNELLTHYHLKEEVEELGHGHFGSVRKLTLAEEKAAKDKATYVLKKPVKPYTQINMNELNGARANSPHITKVLAAIVEDAKTGQIELHQPTTKLIEKPGAYTLKGVVYEYVPGKDLFKFVETLKKDLTSDEIYDYASQMAEGLVAFQAVNGFHGDVKRENYVRHENGMVKLCDFGVSQILEKGHKINPGQSDLIFGTPGFQAPEVCLGHEYDHTADAWSLGATLVDLVCQSSPPDLFDQDSEKLSFEAKTGKLTASQVMDQFEKFSASQLNDKESDQEKLIKEWLEVVGIKNDKFDDLHGVIVGPLTPSQIIILTEEFSQLDSAMREALIRTWVIDAGFNDKELDEFIHVTNELLCYKPAERISIDEAFTRLRAKNNHKQEESKEQLLNECTEITEESKSGERQDIPAIPQIEIESKATPEPTGDHARVVITVTPDTQLEIPKSSKTQRPDLKASNVQDSDKTERNLQLPANKYAPGENLSTLSESLEENLSSDDIYDIVTQATKDIAEFNDSRSFYGNVNPQNFISNQQRVFELKPSEAGTIISCSEWHGGMGTQGFQAPEVCLGNHYDHMADAWSHGATMLAFLLGDESPDYLFAPHSSLTPARKKEIEEGDTLTLTETMKLITEFSEMGVSERKKLIRNWVKEAELDAEKLDGLISVIAELTCFDKTQRISTRKALTRLKAARENPKNKYTAIMQTGLSGQVDLLH